MTFSFPGWLVGITAVKAASVLPRVYAWELASRLCQSRMRLPASGRMTNL